MKLLVITAALVATQTGSSARPEDTEVWAPTPPAVVPGAVASTPPPSDAIRLFDGRDLSQWRSVANGGPARWRVADGTLTVAKD